MKRNQKQKKSRNNFNSTVSVFVMYLQKRGHSKSTISAYEHAVLHYLHWIDSNPSKKRKSKADNIDDFLYNHLPICKCGKPYYKSLKTLRAALHQYYICTEGEKKSKPKKNIDNFSIEKELADFISYLKELQGLSDNTCIYRLRNVRNFLYTIFDQNSLNVEQIKKADFLHYISTYTRHCTAGTKNVIAYSLRSYLKYLQFKGVIKADFVRIVPSVPNWKLSRVPDIFSPEQIRIFLNTFDRTTPVGRRDFAMALSMVDLGLRASEVARIGLHDIDWRQSILYIKNTKSKRDRILPLPRRLGKAIVQYIKRGRLSTTTKELFIRHSVPFGISLNTEQVRGAMRRAYTRAEFSNSITGTHILRHTAASRMHQNGATIKELADVLGHKSIDTTIFYTKINIPVLRNVSLPWPEVKR